MPEKKTKESKSVADLAAPFEFFLQNFTFGLVPRVVARGTSYFFAKNKPPFVRPLFSQSFDSPSSYCTSVMVKGGKGESAYSLFTQIHIFYITAQVKRFRVKCSKENKVLVKKYINILSTLPSSITTIYKSIHRLDFFPKGIRTNFPSPLAEE